MLYGRIEFAWEPHRSERTYFFNKNCVLSFILEYLGIPFEVATLKDKERVEKQVTTMKSLVSGMPFFLGLV